ncbi:MAG: hypothetical protein Q7S10_01820 [bacterium]|nr:hypothetical protein [bacterium]
MGMGNLGNNRGTFIAENIRVNVSGPPDLAYEKEGQVVIGKNGHVIPVSARGTCIPVHSNQFSGKESAKFTMVNMGENSRQIAIKSLSGAVAPFSGRIYLEPGQSFSFNMQTVDGARCWVCWINEE